MRSRGVAKNTKTGEKNVYGVFQPLMTAIVVAFARTPGNTKEDDDCVCCIVTPVVLLGKGDRHLSDADSCKYDELEHHCRSLPYL